MRSGIQALAGAVMLFASLAQAGGKAVNDLHQLFEQEWERGLRESPTSATFYGDRRFNDRWDDLSPAAISARNAQDQAALKRLLSIPRAKLPAAEQLNYDLFRKNLEQSLEGFPFHGHLLQVNQRGGIQTAQEITEVIPFSTLKDYEDWLKRLQSFGAYMDQTIALLAQGKLEGRMYPRVAMERVPGQIAKQLVDRAEDSPFYAPFKQFPDGIPAATRERLRTQAQAAISGVVLPAFARFQTFFDKDYLPACPEAVGLSAQPGGKEYYDYLVRLHTTTKLSAGQIHDIGLREVERIRGEMLKIMQQTGFKGSLQEFFSFLRSDPRFFYDKPEDLLNGYRVIAKRIDPELVKLFGKLPRLPYGVKPIPDISAPDTTTAYYNPGAADGSRAGVFYVNLYKPETRPKWEMEALSVHEAVPGHHLQIALAQELGELPMFRRNGRYTAFVEGWGLYSESLGGELGLYQDPYSKFGQLTYEMWRAVRLVVDTGMHARGWSRQQAIDFFKANAAKTELDINNEIDRYIVMPGQALAYKIGQLKIMELRARAAEKLGGKFDVRAFHDLVLGSGALPLDILERNVDSYIEQRLKE